ncbi:MAG: NAD(P)/FAD-dependent oxidoreductase [Clostridia bacterium]|nr:NAD(P)/FAD-dependent oxidoreductase [Clostridia bacterium]
MNIIIIGAGPAGLMCATQCCKNKNNKVIVLDSNDKVGKKLYITGKGRCNVCNKTTKEDFLSNVVSNSKFLYTAINQFSPEDTISFFESNGTKLKIERGNRVFPVSDKASDISKTFLKILNKENVEIKLNQTVKKIDKVNESFCIKTNKQIFYSDVLVIATGGKSYSVTGSKGDGYNFAKDLGHTVTQIKPALVPINLKDYDGSLAGLSLKNVNVFLKVNNKEYSQFGEMLFTHKGVSGPIILTLSSLVNKFNLNDIDLNIDLKPALSEEKLDERLLRDFKDFKNKNLKNYLKELLPSSLIDFFIKKGNFDANVSVCNITKEVRKKIINLLKSFTFKIKSLEDIEYAIVTSGGINVKEINPKNMESKIVPNLFFIGEVLDLDAFTGGFNIQIALSTGYCSGAYIKNL